jgi:hypothetical protein
MIKISNKEEFITMINERSGVLVSSYETGIADSFKKEDGFFKSIAIILTKQLEKEKPIPSLIIPKLPHLFSFIEKNEFLNHILHDEDKSLPVSLSFEQTKEFSSALHILINNKNNEIIAKINISYFTLEAPNTIETFLNGITFSIADFKTQPYVFYKNKLNTEKTKLAFHKLLNKVKSCNNILQHYSLKYRDFKTIDDLSNMFYNRFDVLDTSNRKLTYESTFIDTFLFIANTGKINNLIDYKEAETLFKNLRFVRRILKRNRIHNYIIDSQYYDNFSMTLCLQPANENLDKNFILLTLDGMKELKNPLCLSLKAYNQKTTKETPFTLQDLILNVQETIKTISLLVY